MVGLLGILGVRWRRVAVGVEEACLWTRLAGREWGKAFFKDLYGQVSRYVVVRRDGAGGEVQHKLLYLNGRLQLRPLIHHPFDGVGGYFTKWRGILRDVSGLSSSLMRKVQYIVHITTWLGNITFCTHVRNLRSYLDFLKLPA